jgi:ubiquinone/menaquinone biosynthesis C-methylase UbiE
MARVNHPLFSRLYGAVAAAADSRGQAEHRAETLAGVEGRVVEVGAGVGSNFRHYPAAVTEVVAVEPEPRMRRQAEEAAASVRVPIRVVGGLASALPFEDGSFDVGVAVLVLCSVPDPADALAELRRVIRPGGELRFYEHVVASSPGLARVQRLADRTFWPFVGGGCHCSRDTLSAIEETGFELESYRGLEFMPTRFVGTLTRPHILGRARRT